MGKTIRNRADELCKDCGKPHSKVSLSNGERVTLCKHYELMEEDIFTTCTPEEVSVVLKTRCSGWEAF